MQPTLLICVCLEVGLEILNVGGKTVHRLPLSLFRRIVLLYGGELSVHRVLDKVEQELREEVEGIAVFAILILERFPAISRLAA